MTFGKYTGKTLAKIPSDYISWLILNGFPNKSAILRAVLAAWEEEK
jgi:uncharacterized protein (DUF3820 family)